MLQCKNFHTLPGIFRPYSKIYDFCVLLTGFRKCSLDSPCAFDVFWVRIAPSGLRLIPNNYIRLGSKTAMTKIPGKRLLAGTVAALSLFALAGESPSFGIADAQAREAGQSSPLVITNEPLPPELQGSIYSAPSRAPQITPSQISGPIYYGDSAETSVGRKVDSLRGELFSMQNDVAALSERLAALQADGQRLAAEYYASVATINTQLQSGTTPGNPRLIQKLAAARDDLEKLSANIAALNDLAIRASQAASMSTFLLESTRATYSLSGAIEEDHVRLAQLEDAINSTVVVVERLLNNANDGITRTTAYLATERDNLRTLSLAINTGDLFGKNLSSRPFSSAQHAGFSPAPLSGYTQPGESAAPAMAPQDLSSAPALTAPRPLVKIRFDRPDVAYEQPVYMAVNEALNRYPNARFELVAVHPGKGNSAEIAIESTRSRRNAERVLRSLTQMGLSMDRVDLSYAPSNEATTNEVHLYVR